MRKRIKKNQTWLWDAHKPNGKARATRLAGHGVNPIVFRNSEMECLVMGRVSSLDRHTHLFTFKGAVAAFQNLERQIKGNYKTSTSGFG